MIFSIEGTARLTNLTDSTFFKEKNEFNFRLSNIYKNMILFRFVCPRLVFLNYYFMKYLQKRPLFFLGLATCADNP